MGAWESAEKGQGGRVEWWSLMARGNGARGVKRRNEGILRKGYCTTPEVEHPSGETRQPHGTPTAHPRYTRARACSDTPPPP